MKTSWLKCNISEGQFFDEKAVSGTTAKGKVFSFFTENENVEETSKMVKVTIVKDLGTEWLVMLPSATLESGNDVITVRKTEVKTDIEASATAN